VAGGFGEGVGYHVFVHLGGYVGDFCASSSRHQEEEMKVFYTDLF
jgi:hypothetical protein